MSDIVEVIDGSDVAAISQALDDVVIVQSDGVEVVQSLDDVEVISADEVTIVVAQPDDVMVLLADSVEGIFVGDQGPPGPPGPQGPPGGGGSIAPSDIGPVMDGAASAGSLTQYSRGDHVHPSDTSRAPLDSPIFVGDPRAPTPSNGDNDTSIATTAFVTTAVIAAAGASPSNANPAMDGAAAPGVSPLYSRYDHVHPSDTSRAPLASPVFTGNPTAPTPSPGDNDTSVATTAFVTTAVTGAVGVTPSSSSPGMDGVAAAGVSLEYSRGDHIHPSDTSRAPLVSPVFTGNPTAPTPTVGDNDTSVATTAFVTAAVVAAAGASPSNATPAMDGVGAAGASALYSRGDHVHPTDTSHAPLASPVFTGNPTAPTPTVGDNDTSLATTAFVTTAVANAPTVPPATVAPKMDGIAAVGSVAKYAKEDHIHPSDTSRAAVTYVDAADALKAPLSSPIFTGNPTAPTPTAGDNDTSIATTAFVNNTIVSPATVVPLVDGVGTVGVTPKYAREDHIHPTDGTRAPLANPVFTGNPRGPTPTAGDNDTSLATTAFVMDAVVTGSGGVPSSSNPLMDGVAAPGSTVQYSRGDHVHPSDTSRAPVASPTITGNATFTGSAFITSGGLEIGSVSGPTTPFVDFHSSGNNLDYDSRILASGGTGSIGRGTLQFYCAAADFPDCVPTAWTAAQGDNSAKLATTAFVRTSKAPLNIRDFGAVGNGSITVSGTGTDDAAAFSAAWQSGAGTTVIVPPGNYRVGGSLDLSGSVRFEFMPGAVLCPDTTPVVVTFRQPVIAGAYRIFGDNGIIDGIRSVRPEWFGAIRNGSNNDAPAINRAIFCAESNNDLGADELEMIFSKGTYALGPAVTPAPSAIIFHPTPSNSWRIRGAGGVSNFDTTILSKPTNSQFAAVWIQGGTGFTSVCDFKISGLAIQQQTQGSGAQQGLCIGDPTGAFMNSVARSLVENVFVQGFDQNFATFNVTMIDFFRCGAWYKDNSGNPRAGCVGYYISGKSGSFTGDFTFTSCQAVCPGNNPGETPSGFPIAITSASSTGWRSGGIRFSGMICYGGSIGCTMIANNGSEIGDIWFVNGTQWEGPVGGVSTCINIVSDGSNSWIVNIHVDGCYLSGNGFFNHIAARANHGGVIESLWVTNNHLSNPNNGGASIDLRAIKPGGGQPDGILKSVTILGNQVRDSAAVGAQGMYIENVNTVTASNNSLTGTSGGLADFIKFNAGCDWVVAMGNNKGGRATNTVINTGGTANSLIINNL